MQREADPCINDTDDNDHDTRDGRTVGNATAELEADTQGDPQTGPSHKHEGDPAAEAGAQADTSHDHYGDPAVPTTAACDDGGAAA